MQLCHALAWICVPKLSHPGSCCEQQIRRPALRTCHTCCCAQSDCPGVQVDSSASALPASSQTYSLTACTQLPAAPSKLFATSSVHTLQRSLSGFGMQISRLQHGLQHMSSRIALLLPSIVPWWTALSPLGSSSAPNSSAAQAQDPSWGPTSALPSSAQLQQSPRSLLQAPTTTPTVTSPYPVITTSVAAASLEQPGTGEKLQASFNDFAQITAASTFDANSSASTLQTPARSASNRNLLIAIVVLASIGVSMLLVALLTAFIVRRRCVLYPCPAMTDFV